MARGDGRIVTMVIEDGEYDGEFWVRIANPATGELGERVQTDTVAFDDELTKVLRG